MSAKEFIETIGWEESIRIYNNIREIVNQTPYKHSLEDFSIELKPYIEAYELVQSYGSISEVNNFLWNHEITHTKELVDKLEKAIKLVEEIEC